MIVLQCRSFSVCAGIWTLSLSCWKIDSHSFQTENTKFNTCKHREYLALHFSLPELFLNAGNHGGPQLHVGDTTVNLFVCSSWLVWQLCGMSYSLLEILVMCMVWAYNLYTQSQCRIDALLAAEKCSLVAKLDVESYIVLFSDVGYDRWVNLMTVMGEDIQGNWAQKCQGGREQLIFIFLAKCFSLFFVSFDDFLWLCLLQEFSNMSKKKCDELTHNFIIK